MQGALPTWHPSNGTLDLGILQVYDVTFQPARLEPYQEFNIGLVVENIGDRDLSTVFIRTELDMEHFPACPLTTSIAKIESLPVYQPKPATLKVDIKNRQNPGPDFRAYPLAIAVLFYSDPEKKNKIHQHNVSLNSVLLTHRLRNWTFASKSPGKILLFGEAGSGKTTLIKTMLSAMKGTIVFTGYGVSTTGATSRHQTTSFRRIELTPSIHILDAWGMQADNATMDELAFRFMITGALPIGWQMNSTIRLLDPQIKHQMQRLHELRPEIVFFIFTPPLINDKAYLSRIKRLIKVMGEERSDMQPFVIITQVDKHKEEFRQNPLAMDHTISQTLAAELGVPSMYHFHSIGYVEERENNPAIDRLVLNVLYSAAKMLEQKMTEQKGRDTAQ